MDGRIRAGRQVTRLHIKRVVYTHTFNGQPNGESVDWVLFDEGQYSQPLVILPDFDIERLLTEIREQRAVAEDSARLLRGSQPVGRGVEKKTTSSRSPSSGRPVRTEAE